MKSRAFMAVVLAISASLSQQASGGDLPAAPVIKVMVMPKEPRPIAISGTTVDVVMENPVMASIVRDALMVKGARVVTGQDAADMTVAIMGGYALGKGGTEHVQGNLREIPLHRDGQTPEESLKYDSPLGRQMVLEGLITRSLSITELLTYLGQRSGLAGAFNKALTGNPDGICLFGCDDRTRTAAVLRVSVKTTDRTESWIVHVEGRSEAIVLGQVLDAGLDAALKPFVAQPRELME